MFFFDAEKGQEISKQVWNQYVQEETSKRAERLKEAVRLGGGALTVARKIGMPTPTLNNYLGGRDMKASAMVLLAAAAGVSLEWLATGEGDPHASTVARQAASEEVLAADLLDSAANFYVFETCIRSCQFFYSKLRVTPTLRNVLKWISDPYRQGMNLPDPMPNETNGDSPHEGT